MSLNLERAWAVDNARMIRDAVSVVLQEGKELIPMAEAAMVGPASEGGGEEIRGTGDASGQGTDLRRLIQTPDPVSSQNQPLHIKPLDSKFSPHP